LIVIPGVQGRWEWMRPALDALQSRCRTISYSLSGELGSESRLDPELGFDNYVRQLDAVFERAGLARAALCGVSYGGFVGVRYAALRPDRVSALVLVSSPAPGWTPTRQQQRYVSRPWISAPAFVVTAPVRLWPEIRTAFDRPGARLGFAARHALRVLAAPAVPSMMAARVRLQQSQDFAADCARVNAPTLVVTGEDGLDRVVPVHVTRSYLSLIRDARWEVMGGTGHIGLVTRPDRFAEIVGGFVHAHCH
jgi:pimeloyl-ACP methyl ester carboxylesterase